MCRFYSCCKCLLNPTLHYFSVCFFEASFWLNLCRFLPVFSIKWNGHFEAREPPLPPVVGWVECFWSILKYPPAPSGAAPPTRLRSTYLRTKQPSRANQPPPPTTTKKKEKKKEKKKHLKSSLYKIILNYPFYKIILNHPFYKIILNHPFFFSFVDLVTPLTFWPTVKVYVKVTYMLLIYENHA